MNVNARLRRRLFRPAVPLGFLLILPFLVLSQPRTEGQGVFARQAPVTFESLEFFGQDSTKGIVDILYRIPRSFFVFVRTSGQTDSSGAFIARGHVMVELSDKQDISIARKILPIEMRRSSLPAREEELGDLEGAFPFTLPRNDYKIVFEVEDHESGRSFVDRQHSVQSLTHSGEPIELSPPFVAGVDSSSARDVVYVPFNHSSNILFGSIHGGLVSQLYTTVADTGLKVAWKLHGKEENRGEQAVDLSGTMFELRSGILTLASSEGPVRYAAQKSDSGWKILYVPTPIQTLEAGTYTIELTVNAGKYRSTREIPFRIIWPNRPVSLTDWDIATDALRYIARPEELDKILSSSEEGWRAFKSFWRAKDPDTTTAYNELMVEYYRRVDEAIRQFSTVKEMDGYKTDRGRIYILNGPPAKIDRSVLPGQPTREIWTYDRLHKQFVFTERNKSGNYILTQATNF